MIEPTICVSEISGIWTRLTGEDMIGVGDVVLYRTQTPVTYEKSNKVNLGEKKRGVAEDGPVFGLYVCDARSDGYLSEGYFVWTRANKESCRLPLNPIFSKPLPLP